MKIDGHYDTDADIVWMRFEGYDASTVVGEEIAAGLREIDSATGRVVGLECWHASATLPKELLTLLPPPGMPQPAPAPLPSQSIPPVPRWVFIPETRGANDPPPRD